MYIDEDYWPPNFDRKWFCVGSIFKLCSILNLRLFCPVPNKMFSNSPSKVFDRQPSAPPKTAQ